MLAQYVAVTGEVKMSTDVMTGKHHKKLRVEFYKPEDCRQVYSIGAVGGHSPYDFRIGFYNDNPRPGMDEDGVQVIQRKLETEVILSPLAALELSRWLNHHLKEYEAMFGPIPQPNRSENKSEPPADNSRENSEIQGYI